MYRSYLNELHILNKSSLSFLYAEEYTIKFTTSPSGTILKFPSYGGIEICKFTEVIYKDRVYDGFELASYVEYREHMEKDMVKATLLNPHEIAILVPGLNYQFHEDYESVWKTPIEFGKSVEMKKYYCDRLKVAHKKSLYKVRANPHLKYRVIVLKFPRTLQLSNIIYTPLSVDGEINSVTMPMVTSLHDTVVTGMRVSWKVHIHDEGAEQVGEEAGSASSKKSANIEHVKNILSRMKIAPSAYEDDDDEFEFEVEEKE